MKMDQEEARLLAREARQELRQEIEQEARAIRGSDRSVSMDAARKDAKRAVLNTRALLAARRNS
jgi:hypothetical protein